MADRKKALVVDDIEGNRKAVKAFLFFLQFDADVASDGTEAMGLLQKGGYDLLVSDIEMPNMNGFELLAWVKKTPPLSRLPVIMLSSLESPEVIQRCQRLGAAAYIVKPFTKEKIQEALSKAGFQG